MLTVGSLFSGIGGFDLGLERAGCEVAWQVEIDPDARRVLRRWFEREPESGGTADGYLPTVDLGRREARSGLPRSGAELFSDVTRVGSDNLTPVDLVCGGFPCQDLSVAGKRAGLAGARSGLWHEFHRILAELHPRWVVIENVPGLLSSNGGADMAVVLGGLAELGYGWAYRVLDAQYFGVAQRRRRVFIVGCLGDSSDAVQVLFEPESCDGNPPPSRAPRESPAGTLGGGSGQRGWAPDTERMTFVPEMSYALAARNAKGVSLLESQDTFIAHALTSEGSDASEDGTGRGTPLVVQGGSQQDQFVQPHQVVPTLAHSSNSHQGHHEPKVWEGASVRRLTPTECERLQGFPDGWTDQLSDSGRYRVLGNAVCVPVAEWIGRRINGR